MTFPLLSISNASKHYGGVPALIDAAFELHSGEVHALMGENGAGKSTLIKLLAGVTQPDTMRAAIRGQTVHINTPQAAFDLGLRFIHQELNVIPQLSVAENLFLSQRYPTRAGVLVKWGELYRRARTVLGDLGIHHINPRHLMARLRPGDQMLVKIASALVEQTQASIYIMDEPTAALTGEEAAMLFQTIERLRQRGCGVVYISHRLDEVFRIANRVTVMRDGRIISTQAIDSTSAPELIRLMTGRKLEQVYPARETSLSSETLLDVHDLTSTAVNGVTFQLRAGEILGVAGLNGSGRSELLRALMGADTLTAGEAQLGGRPLAIRSPSAAWKQGIAFLPEERRTMGLMMSRGVAHNVALPHLGHFSYGGVIADSGREQRATRQLGEQVQLKARGQHQIVRELSGGNQQKVLFARALARKPRLLLLDEPTRGVDVGAKYDIYALIRQTSAAGVGIIVVSSELGELIGMCDRILVMRNGRMADLVSAAGLTDERLLALCYGVGADDRK